MKTVTGLSCLFGLLFNVSEFLQYIEIMQLLTTLVLCRPHGMSKIRLWRDGMLEQWNNCKKRITSVFWSRFFDPWFVYPMNRIMFQPDGTRIVPIFIIPLFHYSNRTTLRLSAGCERSELSSSDRDDSSYIGTAQNLDERILHRNQGRGKHTRTKKLNLSLKW